MRTGNDNGEIQGSLHCAADDETVRCAVEMTWFVVGRAALVVEEEGAVEGVALGGTEAGVADDAAEVLFGDAVGGARSAGLERDGAEVVAAEAQGHLDDLEALGGAAGLDVGDVVEQHAGDGEGAEVLDGGGGLPVDGNDVAGVGVGMEGDGGEGGEAAGLLLEGADGLEVIDALGDGLGEAEDHGGGGAEADLVGGAVGLDPVDLGGRLGGDEGVVAGEGVEAGGVEAGEDLARGEVRGGGEGCDGGGGEAVEAKLRVALTQAGEQGAELVEIEAELRAALGARSRWRPVAPSSRASAAWA